MAVYSNTHNILCIKQNNCQCFCITAFVNFKKKKKVKNSLGKTKEQFPKDQTDRE